MIAGAVAALLCIVAGGAVWARLSASRAERRSLDTYERALDLLGDVAKRSDAVADVRTPSRAELARPHVRTTGAQEFPAPAQSAVRFVPPPRARLEPSALADQPGAPLRAAGESDLLERNGPTPAVVRRDASVADPVKGGLRSDMTERIPVMGSRTVRVPSRGDAEDDEAHPEDEPLVYGPALVQQEELLPRFGPPVPTQAFSPATGPSPAGPPAAAPPTPFVVFDFDDTRPLGDPRPLSTGVPGSRDGHLPRISRPQERRSVRRAATGAAAAVVLGAVVAGGWQLASHKSPPPAASTTTPPGATVAQRGGSSHHSAASHHSATSHHSGPAHHDSVTTTTPTVTTPPTTTPTLPATLRPTSVSATVVTYTAPAGTYTVTFTATTGPCWLGAQREVNTSAYLEMWSLSPGQSASYSATGPLVVKIGAPRDVTIEVNRRPLVLAAGNVQAYDISFTGSTTAPV